MNINVLNGTKRLENLLKFMLSNVSKFTLKSSDLDFCLAFDRLPLLFIWINLSGDFHLSKLLIKSTLQQLQLYSSLPVNVGF